MLTIAYVKENQMNFNDLEKCLKSLFDKNGDILKNNKPSFRTNLRRMIRIYDYLKEKVFN